LHFVRTKDGREADFAVADRKRVWLIVEAKESETLLDNNLPLLQRKVQAQLAVQVVSKPGLCAQKGPHLYVMGADRLLALLP